MSEENFEEYGLEGSRADLDRGSHLSLENERSGGWKNPVRRVMDDRGRFSTSRPNVTISRSKHQKAMTRSSESCGLEHRREDSLDPRVAKKARFMLNGDEHFAGVVVVISAQTTRTFGSLLTELTRLMSSSKTLSQGVRFVFTIDGARINNLDDFEDGGMYVCSSSNNFRPLDYEEISTRVGNRYQYSKKDSVFSPSHLNKGSRFFPVRSNPSFSPHPTGPIDHAAAKSFVHPRFIYIIRNGISRPRKIFRILLNKKTAISFDQVLNTISSKISLDTGAVRKLFTLGDKKVKDLEDFFGADDVFLAYGQERNQSNDPVLSLGEISQLEALGAVLSYPYSQAEEQFEEGYQFEDITAAEESESLGGHRTYESDDGSQDFDEGEDGAGPGGDVGADGAKKRSEAPEEYEEAYAEDNAE